MKDVIIIGAGIAGLEAGLELHKENIEFQILETSPRIGGVIETVKIDDYLIEAGPQTFSSLSKETFDLSCELEIEDKLQEASHHSKKRYIYTNGKLTQAPSSIKDLFKTEIISKAAKWTVFEELFIKKEYKEESVEDFISRRFGSEVLKNIVQPFLNGIYAGDVKKLSASAAFSKLKELEKKYSSILLGFLLSQFFKRSTTNPTLYSFIDGLETLPRAIFEKIQNKVTLGVKEIEITRAKDYFIVTHKVNNKTINSTCNSVLFAIPSYKVTTWDYLLPDQYLADFALIEYVPIAVVSQAIEKTKLNHNLKGFGFLCAKEPFRKLLGTIWTSSIFPNRAPREKALLTSYIGGSHFKKITEMKEEEIINIVTKEVCEILKITDSKSLQTIHIKVHPHAIPQYNLGHIEKVKRIEEIMNTDYGLFFTGNYLYGISINDTIKTSIKVTEKIKNFLKQTKTQSFSQAIEQRPEKDTLQKAAL